jgi:hypothetical protein
VRLAGQLVADPERCSFIATAVADIRKDMTNLSAADIEDFIHKGDARFARGLSRPRFECRSLLSRLTLFNPLGDLRSQPAAGSCSRL